MDNEELTRLSQRNGGGEFPMEIIEVEPYANQVQRFYFEELKWCGCGNPEEALGFMRDVLGIMKARSDENKLGEPYNGSAHERRTKELDALLGDGPLGLSYRYMLDALGLTEHGGSVYGSWLTDKGKDILALLSDRDLDEAMEDESNPLLGEPIPR